MFKKVAVIFLLSLFVMPAHASTITWDLENVAFADNPSVTFQGFFVFDTVANASNAVNNSPVTDWNITMFQNGNPVEQWHPGIIDSSLQSATFYSSFNYTSDAPNSPTNLFDTVGTTTVDLALQASGPLNTPVPLLALVPGQSAGNGKLASFEGSFRGIGSNFGDPISGSLSADVAATPLPAALPLFGTALFGLGGTGWLRRRKS